MSMGLLHRQHFQLVNFKSRSLRADGSNSMSVRIIYFPPSRGHYTHLRTASGGKSSPVIDTGGVSNSEDHVPGFKCIAFPGFTKAICDFRERSIIHLRSSTASCSDYDPTPKWCYGDRPIVYNISVSAHQKMAMWRSTFDSTHIRFPKHCTTSCSFLIPVLRCQHCESSHPLASLFATVKKIEHR